MTPRQILLNAVFVRGMHGGTPTQTAASLGAFGLHQMAPARALAQHLAAGRDFETLGRRLFRFNAFWTSHNEMIRFSQKERVI